MYTMAPEGQVLQPVLWFSGMGYNGLGDRQVRLGPNAG